MDGEKFGSFAKDGGKKEIQAGRRMKSKPCCGGGDDDVKIFERVSGYGAAASADLAVGGVYGR